MSPSQIMGVLTEIYRILKKGGIFIVSVPVIEDFQKIENNSNPDGHVKLYSLELIKAELEINNFKILKSKYLFAFSDNYPFKSLISIILKVRRQNDLLIKAEKT